MMHGKHAWPTDLIARDWKVMICRFSCRCQNVFLQFLILPHPCHLSTNSTDVAIGTQQLQLKSKPNRAEHNLYQFASFFQSTTDIIKFQIATKSKGSFIGANDFLDKTTQK
jgi:hypothetical protein